MPFLFKLAERLARIRFRAVVLTVAATLACEFTDPPLNSPSDPRFATAAVMPGDVVDLAGVGQTSSSVTLAFTEVDDGTGQPAKYEIRSAPGTTVDWGSAASVASGSCSTPVVESGIGARRTCTVLGLTAGTAYAFELVAFRGTLNQGATFGALSNVLTVTTAVADTPTGPGAVSDLTVVGQTSSAVALAFTEVDDGTGQPAKYEIRSALGTTVDWGSAASVASGSCSTPVVGSGIGARRTCTVPGLTAGTAYAFQLVAFRGTLNQGAVFGALSNVVRATTAASTAPVASVTVSPATASVNVGQTVQLTATLKDPSGNVLSGRAVTWTSGTPAVAMVSGSGLVTGVAPGSATLTATSEGQNGSATVRVVASSSGGQVDTIFREDFESGSLNWDDSAGGPTHVVVSDATSAYSGARYLKILYPLGVNGAGSLSKFLPAGYTKAYVRYRLRIPGNFVGGTKLIMFRGSRTDNVWGSFGVAGSCPDGTDWFLANVVSRNLATLPLRFYTYYPGMAREPDGHTCWGRYGDSYDPDGGSANRASYVPPLDLSRDVWHTLEFEVQLNNPGQADGVQRFWLDGVLRGEWRNFVFRTTSALVITALTLESSMNEISTTPQVQELYVDDILVTTGRPAP